MGRAVHITPITTTGIVTTQEPHLPTVTGVSAVRILVRGNAIRHLGASVLCTCAARANAGFAHVAFDACTLRVEKLQASIGTDPWGNFTWTRTRRRHGCSRRCRISVAVTTVVPDIVILEPGIDDLLVALIRVSTFV